MIQIAFCATPLFTAQEHLIGEAKQSHAILGLS